MHEYYKIIAWSDCPYCIRSKELLKNAKKQFMICFVDDSPELLSMYKENHNWQTVPMVIRYKKVGERSWDSEFIGGHSDLVTRFSMNGDQNDKKI